MRFAVHERGKTTFYTFGGLDWVGSGYTEWPDISIVKGCVGGTAIHVMYGGESWTMHGVFDRDRVVCKRMVTKGVANVSCDSLYAEGALFWKYVCPDSQGRVSLGKTIRWVDSAVNCKTIGNIIYRDGAAYAHSKSDGYVDTDIPLNLVRICDMGARDVSMYNGVMYTASHEDDLLWCRDLRSPMSFSINVGWDPRNKHADGPIVNNAGMVLMVSCNNKTVQIVDIRYDVVHYEADISNIVKAINRYQALPD
jgi:hypothetical protein